MHKNIANELSLLVGKQIEYMEDGGDFEKSKHLFFAEIEAIRDSASFLDTNSDGDSSVFIDGIYEWCESWLGSKAKWLTFLYELFEHIPDCNDCSYLDNLKEIDEEGNFYFRGERLG